MKLLERYALECGLKIGKQFLLEKFYPLEHNGPYITIHSSSGMQSKNYPFFQEVIDIIFPLLNQQGIKIFQIGAKEDVPLKGVVHLQGKTSLHQTNYVLSRAILHIGNDSVWQHRAAHLGIPIIDLFGATSAANHAPYESSRQHLSLESHRWNRNPSFSNQEAPQSIALIPPEEIVNSILKIFGAPPTFKRESLFFGSNYQHHLVEWVPNLGLSPEFNKGQPMIVRYDLCDKSEGHESLIIQAAQTRPLHIFTDKQLNLQWVFALKRNIHGIAYEVTENESVEYVKLLKKTGIKLKFFTRISDPDKLKSLRLKFFEIAQIESLTIKNKDNFFKEVEKYTNKSLDKSQSISEHHYYRSNKFILSHGKIYLSKAALAANAPTNNFEANIQKIIDIPEFWEEQDHFYIFKA